MYMYFVSQDSGMNSSPEDIDVRGEGGEDGGQRAGGEVEPGGGESRQLFREGNEDDEGAPRREGDGEDERRDLGGAEFLFGVEEVVHAGGAPAHVDGEAPRRLRCMHANNGGLASVARRIVHTQKRIFLSNRLRERGGIHATSWREICAGEYTAGDIVQSSCGAPREITNTEERPTRQRKAEGFLIHLPCVNGEGRNGRPRLPRRKNYRVLQKKCSPI